MPAMSRTDPRRGFTPIGSADLRTVGLPAREARRLRLERAWAGVAGEAIARRARAADVRRGVLELDIADPAWARQLAPLLPGIVARLTLEFPDLGIRKLKTVVAGEATERAIAVTPADAQPRSTREASDPNPKSNPKSKPSAPAAAEPLSPGDLLEIAARYLDRAREAGRIR